MLFVRSFVVRLVAVIVALLVCSCVQSVPGHRGYVFHPGDVKVGQSTAELLKILGSPTMVSGFDSNVWYYMSLDTVSHVGQAPRMMHCRILQVRLVENVIDELKWNEFDEKLSKIPFVEPKDLNSYQWQALMERAAGSLRATPVQAK